MTELTAEEIKNGWDSHSLDVYRRTRDEVADRVSGNVVTEYTRPKPAIQMLGAGLKSYNPHRW